MSIGKRTVTLADFETVDPESGTHNINWPANKSRKEMTDDDGLAEEGAHFPNQAR